MFCSSQCNFDISYSLGHILHNCNHEVVQQSLYVILLCLIQCRVNEIDLDSSPLQNPQCLKISDNKRRGTPVLFESQSRGALCTISLYNKPK